MPQKGFRAPLSPREAAASRVHQPRYSEEKVRVRVPSAPCHRANPSPGARPAHPTSVKLLLVIRTASFLPRGGPHAMGSGHDPPQTFQDVRQPSALTSCWTAGGQAIGQPPRQDYCPPPGANLCCIGILCTLDSRVPIYFPLWQLQQNPGPPRWHRQEEPGAWQRERRFRQGHMG